MNKKIFTIAIVTIMAISFFASCGARRTTIQEDPTYDVGVVINNVRWATRNVDTSGNFAQNRSDVGGLFTFDEAQNVCPQGWRLPTYEELRSLSRAGGVWTGNGRIFGTAPNQLLLPAMRWQDIRLAIGPPHYVGRYWSSTAGDASSGWWLVFDSVDREVSTANRNRSFSVRCVAE